MCWVNEGGKQKPGNFFLQCTCSTTERRWVLYFRSFRCASALSSCCPCSVEQALPVNPYLTGWGPSWAEAWGTHCLLDAPYHISLLSLSLHAAGKILGSWLRKEWFSYFLFENASVLALACISVCLASQQPARFKPASWSPLLFCYKRLSLLPTPNVSLSIQPPHHILPDPAHLWGPTANVEMTCSDCDLWTHWEIFGIGNGHHLL